MLLSRIYKVVTIIVAALFFTGCALAPKSVVKQDAFGGKKTYALVSISGYDTINKKHSAGQQGVSLGGLVRSLSKSSGFTGDAKPVLNDSAPKFFNALSNADGFKLTPENKVFNNKTYKEVGKDKKKIMLMTIVTPKNYKIFDEKDDAKKLSKAMGTDGVISVNATYSFGFSGLDLFGLIAIGKQKAHVLLSVNATDKKGEVVWQDYVNVSSDDGIWSTTSDVANFDEMHPLFLQASEKAIQEAVRKLNAKLATRG